MENANINTVKVDEDILKFLRAIYFGDFNDPVAAASNRAYRDLNRTLRFDGLANETRKKLREEVTAALKTAIKDLKNPSNFDD